MRRNRLHANPRSQGRRGDETVPSAAIRSMLRARAGIGAHVGEAGDQSEARAFAYPRRSEIKVNNQPGGEEADGT